MKTVLFLLFAAIAIYNLVVVLNLTVLNLSEFGKGYLTGAIILLVVFTTASIWMGKKVFRKASR